MEEAQHFKTQEAILAFCLDIAGCEFLDPKQPCANLFDEEVLSRAGYRGKPLWDASQEAWRDGLKGRVEYILKTTPRCSELIQAYRDQCIEISKPGGNATLLVLDVIRKLKEGSIKEDEALLRIACVNLKTRGDFMNIWKKMVPILTVPTEGEAKFSSAPGKKGSSVQVVERPGFQFLSLNASEKTRRDMGL